MDQCSIVQVLAFYTSGFWTWFAITLGVAIIFGAASRWVASLIGGFRSGWNS